ncbi:MAG: hypothetical protein LUF33_00040 [Clostridiales bacterium]|nr:hypothetical protein [Clostridiales bacterium]
MATANTGVFPCYENQFAVAASGSTSVTTTIANCEEFSVSFDNGVEEWYTYDQEGWKARLRTAKSVTVLVKGKRTIGDTGNDMIAALAYKNGRDCELNFLWTFPDDSTVLFEDAVISVTANGAGASTSVGPLEFEVMSNGKPTYTAAA